jgi:nitroimidazol reductase NimA-like FMN-containing flavoprotein (pyridoxamine 5'-phosphate oxidase superfamily)
MSKSDQDEPPAYEITDRNRIKRRSERAHYDAPTVHAILDAALVCHIAYFLDEQPYCTPTAFWRQGESLFWHGSSMSRMLRSQGQGMNVCLTVTHIDSLVLARSAFEHSINYRSAMVFGEATLIDDPQQKLQALNSFVNRFYPGRSKLIRQPTEQELAATSVVTMHIDQASAKIRAIPPREEREEEYDRPVWAGLIPIALLVGAPVACARLRPDIKMGRDVSAYREGEMLGSVLSSLAREGVR